MKKQHIGLFMLLAPCLAFLCFVIFTIFQGLGWLSGLKVLVIVGFVYAWFYLADRLVSGK